MKSTVIRENFINLVCRESDSLLMEAGLVSDAGLRRTGKNKKSGMLSLTFCAFCSIVLKGTDVQYRAPVAQGIEQWFPVPRVGGSNPSRCVLNLQGNYKTEEG